MAALSMTKLYRRKTIISLHRRSGLESMVNGDRKFTRTVEDGLNSSGTLLRRWVLSSGNVYSVQEASRQD